MASNCNSPTKLAALPLAALGVADGYKSGNHLDEVTSRWKTAAVNATEETGLKGDKLYDLDMPATARQQPSAWPGRGLAVEGDEAQVPAFDASVGEVASLRKLLAEERQMRHRDAAELQKLRTEFEQRGRQVLAAETDAAKMRMELEAERQLVSQAQGSLASMAAVLDQQRQKEEASRLRAERLESALMMAEASLSAVNRQGLLRNEVQAPAAASSAEGLIARAERAETALVAAEAALSTLKCGHRSCLMEEAEYAQLQNRLERAEAKNATLEKALNALLEKRQSQESSAATPESAVQQGGPHRPTTPKAPCRPPEVSSPPSAAAVTTTFGTPCGETPTGDKEPSHGAHSASSSSAAPAPSSWSAGLARPTWDGQYLSSPKRGKRPPGLLPLESLQGEEGDRPAPDAAEAEAAAETADQPMDDDGLPLPPSSRCWDWPLSRPEKQERVAMMDAQLLLYDQRGLIEEVEALRGVCAQHGLVPPASAASAASDAGEASGAA